MRHEPLERHLGLGALSGHLLQLGLERLHVAVHALVLPYRLRDVLFPGEARVLAGLDRLPERQKALTQGCHLGVEGRRCRLGLAQSLGQPLRLAAQLAERALAPEQRMLGNRAHSPRRAPTAQPPPG